jgi:hypothetical protein
MVPMPKVGAMAVRWHLALSILQHAEALGGRCEQCKLTLHMLTSIALPGSYIIT